MLFSFCQIRIFGQTGGIFYFFAVQPPAVIQAFLAFVLMTEAAWRTILEKVIKLSDSQGQFIDGIGDRKDIREFGQPDFRQSNGDGLGLQLVDDRKIFKLTGDCRADRMGEPSHGMVGKKKNRQKHGYGNAEAGQQLECVRWYESVPLFIHGFRLKRVFRELSGHPVQPGNFPLQFPVSYLPPAHILKHSNRNIEFIGKGHDKIPYTGSR